MKLDINVFCVPYASKGGLTHTMGHYLEDLSIN